MSVKQEEILQTGALVAYKSKPALVIKTGEKIEIELDSGKTLKVRKKDVEPLHPGPLQKLSALKMLSGSPDDARELLEGETTTLPELAELIYGEYSPSSAMAVYELLQDEIYFHGSFETVSVRSASEVDALLKERKAREAEQEGWKGFIEELSKGKFSEEERHKLFEVEDFAYGSGKSSKILKALNLPLTPESGHRFLLNLGYWDAFVNPHIKRFGFSAKISYPELPEPVEEERLDLTHLEAFAIDDPDNKDPDDAISLDGEVLWVHVADVASLITPDSEADIQARGQGANLYLPEGTVTMLPPKITQLFGLGLSEISPALSFRIILSDEGDVADVDIFPSRIRVTRMTYAQAEERLGESPFKEIYAMTLRFRAYRKNNGAVFINFPEAKFKVEDGRVIIRRLPELESNGMVAEAMMMAGEGAAKFAQIHDIPFPYTTQPAPDKVEQPETPADMFAYRKKMKPSQIKSAPDSHAGLGLPAYSRATSPIRRYVDLLAHQQLRAFLCNRPLLSEEDIVNRIGTYEAVIGSTVKLERASNRHWTLVFLMQNPEWKGEGIVLDKKGNSYVVLIPDLAMEVFIGSSREFSRNDTMQLSVESIDLPSLEVQFSIGE